VKEILVMAIYVAFFSIPVSAFYQLFKKKIAKGLVFLLIFVSVYGFYKYLTRACCGEVHDFERGRMTYQENDPLYLKGNYLIDWNFSEKFISETSIEEFVPYYER